MPGWGLCFLPEGILHSILRREAMYSGEDGVIWCSGRSGSYKVDRSGCESHTGILKWAAQGTGGWAPRKRVDLGGLDAFMKLADPWLLRHPDSNRG